MKCRISRRSCFIEGLDLNVIRIVPVHVARNRNLAGTGGNMPDITYSSHVGASANVFSLDYSLIFLAKEERML